MYYERKFPSYPWIVKGAVEFIDQYLDPNDQILEFGSGRSTSWFLRRGCSVISIETDRKWHDKVRKDNINFIKSKKFLGSRSSMYNSLIYCC